MKAFSCVVVSMLAMSLCVRANAGGVTAGGQCGAPRFEYRVNNEFKANLSTMNTVAFINDPPLTTKEFEPGCGNSCVSHCHQVCTKIDLKTYNVALMPNGNPKIKYLKKFVHEKSWCTHGGEYSGCSIDKDCGHGSFRTEIVTIKGKTMEVCAEMKSWEGVQPLKDNGMCGWMVIDGVTKRH